MKNVLRHKSTAAAVTISRFLADTQGDIQKCIERSRPDPAHPVDPRVNEFFVAAKSAVGSINSSGAPSPLLYTQRVAVDLSVATLNQSVLGKITAHPAAQFLPFHAKIGDVSAYAGAAWRKQGQAIPVGKVPLNGDRALTEKAISAMVVCSNELLCFGVDKVDQLLENALRAGMAKSIDARFLSDSALENAPEGIFKSASKVTTTGKTLAERLADLIKQYETTDKNSLADAVLLLDTASVLQLDQATQTQLALLGVTVQHAPFMTVATAALINVRALGIAASGALISRSTEGNVVLDDAPKANSVTPTSEAGAISLFQNNCTAFKLDLIIDWVTVGKSVAYIGV